MSLDSLTFGLAGLRSCGGLVLVSGSLTADPSLLWISMDPYRQLWRPRGGYIGRRLLVPMVPAEAVLCQIG